MAKFLFNFKKVFAPMVRDGAKLQTIRATRADRKRPAIGDIACCYTGLRTRNTELLREAVVTSCQAVRMDLQAGQVIVDGRLLTAQEVTELAQRDGFSSRAAMLAWFADNHGSGTFEGFITTWAKQEITP